MLRYRRLTDPELVADHPNDLARRHLVIGQQLENASSDRIAEDIERVHTANIRHSKYKSSLIFTRHTTMTRRPRV